MSLPTRPTPPLPAAFGACFGLALLALVACGDDAAPSNTAQNNTAARDAATDTADTDGIDSTDLPDTAAPDADASPDVAPDAPEPLPACTGTYAPPESAGAIGDDLLTEASGIVASRQNPGVLWLHNDSGDSARLYAIGTDGRALGRLRMSGVDAVDFEDIAAADCPAGGGHCLWVADVGNNRRDRTTVVVYAVREPPVDPEDPFVASSTSTVWSFPLTFPDDAPFDAEALMLSPDGSDLYLFEKSDGDSARLYRHPGPLVPDQPAELAQVATFPSPGVAVDSGRLITAADLHPSGQRLLVRVYTASFEYRLTDTQTLADLGQVEPLLVAPGPLSEPQGEAIAYDEDGIGVWTVSEDDPGQPLHYYPCVP